MYQKKTSEIIGCEKQIKKWWLTIELAGLFLNWIALALTVMWAFVAKDTSSTNIFMTGCSVVFGLVLSFLVRYFCAYKRNGTKLLAVFLFVGLVNLFFVSLSTLWQLCDLVGFGINLSRQSVQLLFSNMIGLPFAVLGLIVNYRLYRLNEAKQLMETANNPEQGLLE